MKELPMFTKTKYLAIILSVFMGAFVDAAAEKPQPYAPLEYIPSIRGYGLLPFPEMIPDGLYEAALQYYRESLKSYASRKYGLPPKDADSLAENLVQEILLLRDEFNHQLKETKNAQLSSCGYLSKLKTLKRDFYDSAIESRLLSIDISGTYISSRDRKWHQYCRFQPKPVHSQLPSLHPQTGAAHAPGNS
jgi:hypothetical protein